MSGWVPVLLAAAAASLLVAGPPVGRSRLAGLSDLSDRAAAFDLRLGLGGAAVAVLVVLGPVAAAVALGAGVAAARMAGARRAAAAAARERGRALEALAVLGGDLRAGRAPAEALAATASVAVGGTRRALLAAAGAAELGGDVPAALDGPSEVPEVLRGLAACWAVCAVSGSGLAAGVERLSEGLRAADAQRRAVAAELAGPRATAALLATLPLAGMAMAAALGARPLHVLLHTPAGVVCLLLGLSLDGLGLLWAGRLVARAGGT